VTPSGEHNLFIIIIFFRSVLQRFVRLPEIV